jgi:hypothetical protein
MKLGISNMLGKSSTTELTSLTPVSVTFDWWLFIAGSYYLIQAVLELTIFLPQPLNGWDYRPMPPCWFISITFDKSSNLGVFPLIITKYKHFPICFTGGFKEKSYM